MRSHTQALMKVILSLHTECIYFELTPCIFYHEINLRCKAKYLIVCQLIKCKA